MSQAAEEVAARPNRDHSVRSAVIWSYVLSLGRFAVGAGVTLLLAFILNPHAFGVMALAMVWVYFAQMLSLHGPSQAIIQREEVTGRHLDAAFWVTVAANVVLAAVFAAVAPLWAAVNGEPELAAVCWWLSGSIVLNSVFVVPESILRRTLQFRTLGIRVLVAGLISGVVAVAVAAAGYGVWALVAQQLVISGVSAVLIWFVVPWRPTLRRWGGALRDLRRYSLNSLSEFFAGFVYFRADALLLGGIFGAVAIGLYRFAMRLVEIVIETASGGLAEISLPDLARFADAPGEFAARLGRLLHTGAAVALPLFGILAAVAADFLRLLGPEWTPATAALRVLCVAGSMMAVATILGAAIQATGRNGLGALLGWIEAGVMVVVLLLVGWLLSGADTATQVLGVALAYTGLLGGGIVAVGWILFGIILKVPALPHLRPVLPPVGAGVAAAALGWGASALMGLVHAPALVAVAVTGLVAAAAGATTLLLIDREVADRVRPMVDRVRSRYRRGHEVAVEVEQVGA